MFRTLLTCTAACLLAVACAQAPVAPKDATASNTKPIECVGPSSASRIPNSACAQGQAYSQDDIRSTGKPTAAGALTLLDPTVH